MASLKCEVHGVWECAVCFSTNQRWLSDAETVTPRGLRIAAQHLKTLQGVEDARKRNRRAADD